MRLFFDENLSRKLVHRLADLFPGSMHVADANLLQSPDADFWEHAKAHGYTIVTADADFHEMAMIFGPPPKVIWLRACDYRTPAAEQLLLAQAIRISEFLLDSEQSVLIPEALTRRCTPCANFVATEGVKLATFKARFSESDDGGGRPRGGRREPANRPR